MEQFRTWAHQLGAVQKTGSSRGRVELPLEPVELMLQYIPRFMQIASLLCPSIKRYHRRVRCVYTMLLSGIHVFAVLYIRHPQRGPPA
jgi:hypothetical protein